jgi:GDP-4-dehydro-6-deoxy-D-mannose reductase
MDIPLTRSLIRDIQPDYAIHLAAQSSVAESWESPISSFLNNTNIFLNIIDSIRLECPHCKVLSIGSSEQYGVVADCDLPLVESAKQNPSNPYAVARLSQEYLAKMYADGYHLDVCCTRSFNHCGPGQHEKFVVSGIVKQCAEIALGKKEPVVRIGDGSIVRDFLDIHDVVRAYTLLLEKGGPGEIYNVCSGRGRTIRSIVETLNVMYGLSAAVEEDPSWFRPIDNPKIIGNYSKLKKAVGWTPEVGFEESVRSMFHYWCTRLR